MAARDIMFIGIVIFALAVGFFSLNYIFNVTFTKIAESPVINESQAAVDSFNGTINNVVNKFDYIIMGTFIAFILALLISSWFIGGNPIFMVIYFIIVVIVVVVSAVFANFWETYSAHAVFGTTLTLFPITNNIMLNLPIYMAIVAFLGIVTMFAKPFIAQNEY